MVILMNAVLKSERRSLNVRSPAMKKPEERREPTSGLLAGLEKLATALERMVSNHERVNKRKLDSLSKSLENLERGIGIHLKEDGIRIVVLRGSELALVSIDEGIRTSRICLGILKERTERRRDPILI